MSHTVVHEVVICVYKVLTVGLFFFFFFQAEDGIRDKLVTGVQTCALPIWPFGRGSRTPRVPHRVGVRSLARAIVGADARPNLFGSFALVQEAAAFLSGGRQASEHTAAVRGMADPVDLRIVPDRRMLRVDEDHLVVLVHPVLADPIRVEDLHVRIVLGGPLLRDPLDRLRHRDLDEPTAFRVSPAHRAWPAPASAPDPRTDDDIPLFRAISQLAGAIDPRRPLHADEGVTATPLDHPLKMRLLDHAAPRILPRLLDVRVQVPRTSGRLRFPFRGNARLRFRSLWGLVGHGPTPWIYGFARSTSPDQGRRKRRAKGRALLKRLLVSRRRPCATAVPLPDAVLVRLD